MSAVSFPLLLLLFAAFGGQGRTVQWLEHSLSTSCLGATLALSPYSGVALAKSQSLFLSSCVQGGEQPCLRAHVLCPAVHWSCMP